MGRVRDAAELPKMHMHQAATTAKSYPVPNVNSGVNSHIKKNIVHPDKFKNAKNTIKII